MARRRVGYDVSVILAVALVDGLVEPATEYERRELVELREAVKAAHVPMVRRAVAELYLVTFLRPVIFLVTLLRCLAVTFRPAPRYRSASAAPPRRTLLRPMTRIMSDDVPAVARRFSCPSRATREQTWTGLGYLLPSSSP